MNGIAQGFLTGFMNDQAEKITKRKSMADEYFQNQMELAHKKALTYTTQNAGKMDAALGLAKQMVAIGVPERTVMAIANQNPDDLQGFFDTVQDYKAKGVEMTPDFYDQLIKVDGQFNPGNENVTSLFKRIYEPLTANAKADPKGFDFDPGGTLWATMLGYNAMDKARERLADTEVMPGVSASQVLSGAGDENSPLGHPLGNASVTLNAELAGDALRSAKQEQSGSGELTISERGTLLTQFGNLVKDRLSMVDPSIADMNERDTIAKEAAAKDMLIQFPEAAALTDITKWIRPSTAAGSPATAPTTPEATPTPTTPTMAPTASPTASEPLPNGAVFVRDYGDGQTSVYRMPSGKEVRVRNSEVESMKRGITSAPPVTQTTPTPGWLDQLGSEYDNRR